MLKVIMVLVSFFSFFNSYGQNLWIGSPVCSNNVAFYRTTFNIDNIPENCIIDVSADSKFMLYINNEEVGEGPAISSIDQWAFNSFDISPFLKVGKNVISVIVVKWDKNYLPASKNENALMIKTVDPSLIQLTTSEKNIWKSWVFANAHRIYPYGTNVLYHPGYDSIDFKDYPWGWKKIDFDDSEWQTVRKLGDAIDGYGGLSPWNLSPSVQTKQIKTIDRFQNIKQHSSLGKVNDGFLQGSDILVVEKNSQLVLLLDAGKIIHGSLKILIDKGEGAQIKIKYSDALYNSNREKVNRTDGQGSVFGPYDIFIASGKGQKEFQSFHERTCRFVELNISTNDEVLEIHDFYFSDLKPFDGQSAYFNCSDESLSKIWNAGANTLDILSREIPNSSAINENVPFLPEVWAIGLANCYYAGNGSLMRQAIDQFRRSQIPEGLVNSCAPCNMKLIVPHYSLYYILMVSDYFNYSGDVEFLKKQINTIENILVWYQYKIGSNDVVIVNGLDNNIRFRESNNHLNYGTAFNTILYIYALNVANGLFDYCGITDKPLKFQYLTEKLRRGIVRENLETSNNLFVEEKGGDDKLKITNIFAMLSDIIVVEEDFDHLMAIINSDSMIELTLFERFFLGRLLSKYQNGEIYNTQILPWHNMILDGLTTLGDDRYNTTGNDVYGGGVTPCLNLIGLTAGISPYKPGYEKIMISPEPGHIDRFEISIFIPQGQIVYSFEKTESDEIMFNINLPKGVTGYLKWMEKLTPIRTGKNVIKK